MFRIISNKKYNEMVEKIEMISSKNVNLVMDKADLQAQIDIYDEQVKYLLNEISELKKKKETTKPKRVRKTKEETK